MKQGRGIKWVLFLSFVLLAAFGGGCGGGGSHHSSDSSVPDTSSKLKAGAGIGEIDLTKLFVNGPIGEGFYDVYDNPHARVLVLETNEKIAILTLELVNPNANTVIAPSKKIVAETLEIPEDNVWVHVTHTITTPHPNGVSTDIQEIFATAVTTAVTEAALQAKESFQPAVAGVDTGYADFNYNRNIKIGNNWYVGLGNTGGYGQSDKDLTILRVDSVATGKHIGFLMNYGMKPDVINNTPATNTNLRLISTDMPGFVSLYMEEKFDAPALYIMGAAADQIPKETAYYSVEENGAEVQYRLPVAEGLRLVKKLGTEMGNLAVDIANGITPTESGQKIALGTRSFEWQEGGRAPVPGVMATFNLKAIQFGDVALVGAGPEIYASLGIAVKKGSPFDTTIIVSCTDNISQYLPDSDAFDNGISDMTKSSYGKGAGEQFVIEAIALLKELFTAN
jgi:hypothetical protein